MQPPDYTVNSKLPQLPKNLRPDDNTVETRRQTLTDSKCPGEKISKITITALTLLTVVPVYVLIEIFDVGYMDMYFYICLIILIFFLLYLWKSDKKEQFLQLHNILKTLIVAGVFCIVLINPSVLWHGRNLLLTIEV